MEAFPRREKLNKHLRQLHGVSDDDIKMLAEKGPDSEEAKKILDRLKSNVANAKEEEEEYVDLEYAERSIEDDAIENDNDDEIEEKFILP